MERQSYIDVCHTSPDFLGYGFDLVQFKRDGQWCRVALRRGWAEVESRNGVALARFATRCAADCVLAGEYMPNGQIWVFDAPEWPGTYAQRMARAEDVCQRAGTFLLSPVASWPVADAPALWATVERDRGEGLVYRRSTDCYAGAIIGREKRVQTYDGACVEKSNRGLPVFDFEGVRQAIAGVPADECRPGRVAEFSAFARFASGKLRNPVFLRWRDDKPTP